MKDARTLPLLAPGVPLPAYAFVPGHFPHPVRDPQGHRHGRSDEEFGSPPETAWGPGSDRYRHVLDLLNHGFYWEAHEGLEKWWREVPPDDPRHAFFHGLLRLAAAGVKAREGRTHGVRTHLTRALGLLRRAQHAAGGEHATLLGVRPGAVSAAIAELLLRADQFVLAAPLPIVEPVLGVVIEAERDPDDS